MRSVSARSVCATAGARETVAMKPSGVPRYTTKELSTKTWPDFERLFCQGGGWDFCKCMHFHRPHTPSKVRRMRSRVEKGETNRKDKKALVVAGRSHGILVYAEGQPVGWCQYGPCEELPRIDHSRKYAALSPEGRHRLWRITCFVVHKKYRRRGVATAALRAALESIRRHGGGLVEAYPIDRWLTRAFGNESTHGTASMFQKAGFKPIVYFGETRFSSHVLMRRTVRMI
jgi:GNAT superfamily N-acetyltransferase